MRTGAGAGADGVAVVRPHAAESRNGSNDAPESDRIIRPRYPKGRQHNRVRLTSILPQRYRKFTQVKSGTFLLPAYGFQ